MKFMLQMFLTGNRTDQKSTGRTFSSRNTANVFTDIRAATLNNRADVFSKLILD